MVWITGPFLMAGAGAGVGGLRPGVGEAAGLGVMAGAAAVGLGGAGFESGGETPAGLGARFGAGGQIIHIRE